MRFLSVKQSIDIKVTTHFALMSYTELDENTIRLIHSGYDISRQRYLNRRAYLDMQNAVERAIPRTHI